MTFVPVMISVWAALILFFFAVRVYIGRVSRNEEDQILLSESSKHIQAEQDAIAARIQKLVPLQRTSQILLGASTLVVAGYFVLNILHQLSF